MISSFRLKQGLLIALPVFAIVFFYLIKVFQFQQNQENFWDGTLTLQLSRGWLEGKGLLMDNIYGNHAKLHNYYFIILLGPLTRITGIYGLFMVYLALLGVFFLLWKKGFSKFGALQWRHQWLAAIFYAFGPIGYFVFVDRFGWHPEHYFIPLMALLALSLARRQLVAAAILGFLILSVKETSGVLLFCLLIFCSITDLTLTNPGKTVWKYIFYPRNVFIGAICFILFCAGMWWLSHLNAPEPSRLALAIKKLGDNLTLINLISHSVPFWIVAVLTAMMGLFPFITLLRVTPQKSLIVWTLMAGCTILSTVYFIESLFYFKQFILGMPYAPRIGGLWAFIFSSYIFYSYRLFQSGLISGIPTITWTLSGFIVQLLIGSFLVTHSFVLPADYYRLRQDISYMIKTRMGWNPYVNENAKQLYSLAKRMPVGADVIVPGAYLGCFHRVYPGAWELQSFNLPFLKKPLLFVYEKRMIKKDPDYRFPRSGYTVIPNKELLILAESKWYNQNFK